MTKMRPNVPRWVPGSAKNPPEPPVGPQDPAKIALEMALGRDTWQNARPHWKHWYFKYFWAPNRENMYNTRFSKFLEKYESKWKWRSKSIDKYDSSAFRVVTTLVKYDVAERTHAKSIVLYTISGPRKSLRQKRVLVRSRAPQTWKTTKTYIYFNYFFEVRSGTRKKNLYCLS